jgi:uncharacterized membrane protein
MAVLFGLLSAFSYGISDFAAGLASRAYRSAVVAAAAQFMGLLTAAVAVLIFPGHGPTAHALLWGALSGIGSGFGTMALYHGLAVGRMSVVAPLSAVLTAVLPVIVGLVLGNHLSVAAAVGIALAIPAIALVSWQPGHDGGKLGTGAQYGVLAGVGFGLLFIALDRAGTGSGAWPLLPGQTVSLVPTVTFACRQLRGSGHPTARTGLLIVATGVLGGTANLLFLAATGHGQLAVVAVLSALYPAMTVIMARLFLSEHWTRPQVTGFVVTIVAIILVSV